MQHKSLQCVASNHVRHVKRPGQSCTCMIVHADVTLVRACSVVQNRMCHLPGLKNTLYAVAEWRDSTRASNSVSTFSGERQGMVRRD